MPYFSNLITTVQKLKNLLSKDGKLILTGLNYFHDPTPIITNLERLEINFFNTYGVSFLFNRGKGYLDQTDLDTLKKMKVELKVYPSKRLKTLFSILFRTKPMYYYGLYTNSD